MKLDLRKILVFGGCITMLSSCASDSGGGGGSGEKPTIEKSGSGTIYHLDFDSSQGNLQYTHETGSTPQDVYFIFTNPTFSQLSGSTTVNSEVAANHAADSDVSSPAMNQSSPIESEQVLGPQMGTDDVSEFNRTHPLIADNPGNPFAAPYMAMEAPLLSGVTVGSTDNFYNYANTNSPIAATVRARVEDPSSDVVVNFWVADDSYGSGCGKAKCMTAAMVDQFAEKFVSDTADDIYKWVTDIVGAPWGPHVYSGSMITATSPLEIDVLFYDIGNDNSTNGGVLGVFAAKDNYRQSVVNYSNQRLMFYLDSVLAATDQYGSWDISDDWPAYIVSTLAHEFQHMINWYQKRIKHQLNAGSDVWINEMASMVIEDLLAAKMQVDGPRAVLHSNQTAGAAYITDGRLRTYNQYSHYSVTDWYYGTTISYGMNYSLGAYLARNYGGAELFRKIVQNQYTDYRAITQALADLGYHLSFSDVLQRWGTAVMLSDDMAAPVGYRYNTGTWFNSSVSGTDYQLGSINIFHYQPNFEIIDLSKYYFTGYYRTSNTFSLAGTRLTGSNTWDITMPAGVRLSIVTKDSD